MQKAIALLSGGLDSAVATALWLESGNSIHLALTLDYGQRAAREEARAAKAFADRHALPWERIQLPFLEKAAAGSALVNPDRKLPGGTSEQPGDHASAAAVWVPARNLVFLSVAAALAEAAGIDVLLTGFNAEEAQTFPDNSADFLDAMNRALALATRTAVRVESPTLSMDKPAIAVEAHRLGIKPTDLWSCYGAGPEPCGVCESCLRSARAWQTIT